MTKSIQSPFVIEHTSHFEVRTPYDAQIIRAMRGIGGRWSEEGRCWEVPRKAHRDLADILPAIEYRVVHAAIDIPDMPSPPIPLKQEFVVAIEGAELFPLVLECVNAQTAAKDAWVAQIFATDGKDGWVRHFVAGRIDWSRANKRGRGVRRVFLLQQGPIYEVNCEAETKMPRYLFRVVDGNAAKLDKYDIASCLVR